MLQPEVSVVMPCLNEAETLQSCVRKAMAAFQSSGIVGEVIVADNGSSDGSQEIAASNGARVANIKSRGYGSALMGGIGAAKGKYVVMADSDDSYDFSQVPRFVQELRKGYDIVLGNRFQGGILQNAMPPLHRYLGNPGLTAIGRAFFDCPSGDLYCGMRGFTKEAYDRLQLRTTGMEFATEMVIKATLMGLKIGEIPTTLSPDGRTRKPHLRTWRDGWRTLRFFLLYSPRWLFLYPGILLMIVGLVCGLVLMGGPRVVGHVTFDAHTLLYCAIAVLLGFQALSFAVLSKLFAISEGLLPPDRRLDRFFEIFTLEVGLLIGSAMVVLGLGGSIYAVHTWGAVDFGHLDYSRTMRLVIPSAVMLTLGVQTVFVSFFGSLLGMARK